MVLFFLPHVFTAVVDISEEWFWTICLIYYPVTFILSLVLVGVNAWDGIKDIINNKKKYIKMFVFMADTYVIGFKLVFEILERLSVDTSTNQEAINKLPIRLTFIMCILYAPVVEETIYRYCLKEIVYNKFLFVICSGLLFGMAHVVFVEATVYTALVCSLPYVFGGLMQALIYQVSNNIAFTILFHALYNSVTLLPIIIYYLR